MNVITERPWGTFQILYEDDLCKIKRIVVFPGHKLSLQSHKHRDETWKISQGHAKIEVSPHEYLSYSINFKSSCVYIKRGEKHRIENIGKDDLIFIEIQTGDYFGEDDIERFEDIYGRV